MRQRLGARKLRLYSRLTGETCVSGMVRGGTYHRVDLVLEDGRKIEYWRNGEITGQTGIVKVTVQTEDGKEITRIYINPARMAKFHYKNENFFGEPYGDIGL